MNKETYTAKNVVKIKTNPEEAFSLACPVKELDWIRGWSFEMIKSDSGVNEVGCIFKETMSGGLFGVTEPTHWLTTIYDKEAKEFHAVLTFGGYALGKFEFTAEPEDDQYSYGVWTLSYTSLNDQGDRVAGDDMADKLKTMLGFLGSCAKHYLETGEML
jgi:hypothetical protein